MAAAAVTGPSSRPESNAPSVVLQLQAYATDSNSAEQALSDSAEEMQSQPQIRNRLQQGQPGATSARQERRTPEVGTVLNSEISDHGRSAAWRRRLSGLLPNPFSPSTTHSEDFQQLRGYSNFQYEKLEKYTNGIPRLAALHDSNDSFSMYRRFGSYAARILLHRELELNELARKLDILDKEDVAAGRNYRLQSIEHREDWDSNQRDLIDQIQEKMTEYYDFLLKYVQVRALDQPRQRNVHGIYDWIADNLPLEEKEVDYILHVDDFVLARTTSNRRSLDENRIEDFLESCASRWPWFSSILKTKEEKRKTTDRRVHHFSSRRLAMFANAITVLLAVGGLLIPVFLLFLVPMHRDLMACVALGFVLAFSVTMSIVTEARVQDVLIGTAAYGAVVIMFLGNLNQSPGSEKL